MKKIVSFVSLALVFFQAPAQEKPEGLFIGSKAPDFRTKDQHEKEIHLRDQLKVGKVILLFYRGQWCPYSMKQLARFQDSLRMIKEKGATLIVVGPEKPENVAKTAEEIKPDYSILYDAGLKIMKGYDVVFEVPENTLTRYRNTGLDIEKNNGTNGKHLPVTAAYIIDKESTIVYRYFEEDYKKRPSVKELLDHL